MTALIRWTIFIFIGYPLHIVTMLVYPLIHLFWRIYIFKHQPKKLSAEHENMPLLPKHMAIRNNCFHDNTDDHSALTHWGLFLTDVRIGMNGLMRLIDMQGNFLRRWTNGKEEGFHTSGDAVINWCFAAALYEEKYKGLASVSGVFDLIAEQYLKNLGTIANMGKAKGWVSVRCNNFGVNFCPDSQALFLGQPCAGPQFYTTSAVLALAAKEHFKWEIVFWLHWIFMGGWLWAFSPVLYTKDKGGWYLRDIVMKSLFVHKLVFGNSWWIRIPMEFITDKIATTENALFYAMTGRKASTEMPQVMNPTFSQSSTGISREDGRLTNVWIRPGIEFIESLK